MNVFSKVKQVRLLVRRYYGDMPPEELVYSVRQCAKWHYNKKKPISEDNARVYEILLKNGYNPDTVYKWFLLVTSPMDVKQKLACKKISQRDAFKEKNDFKELLSLSEQDLIHDIVDCMRRYVVR